jgi:glycosyltransferase involved in cell wall biosynthesis
MKKIGFDFSYAEINPVGTGSYVRNLSEAIRDESDDFSLNFFTSNFYQAQKHTSSITSRLLALYRDLVWLHILIPLYCRRSSIDLLHMPANLIPASAPCPVVVTIHDTILYQPNRKLTFWQRNYFLPACKRSAINAHLILTVSESSKNDIINTFNIPPEKIVVTNLAASAKFRVQTDDQIRAIKEKYQLDRFILTVGSLETRKNLKRVFLAFSHLHEKFPNLKLVHAGPINWQNDDLLSEPNRLDLKNDILFLGKVSEDDLISLYNAARVFVFPSIYEGFGLPVVEAMACGCPVVTSNVSSIPEVAGKAAFLIDPLDEQQIEDAIADIISDPDLASKLREAGLERATHFSWERCAKETLKVYQRVLSA